MTERRRQRWARRAVLARAGDRLAGDRKDWSKVPFARTAGCGRMLTGDEAYACVREGDDGPTAYVAGVSTCASVWACPVCSAKIRTRRQIEVETIATAHANTGGTFAMITLTTRHGPEHRLGDLIEAQNTAWRTIQQDENWRKLRKGDARGPRGGLIGNNGDGPLVGVIRSKEVTQGLDQPGGSWHPHDHILLLWADDEDHEGDCAWIEQRWCDLLEAATGARPNSHGYHYTPMGADSAAYVTKLAQEAARGDLKGGSRSVWHLVDGVSDGETWAVRAWCEYVTATKGRRAIQMSRGLRARYGLDEVEASDEDLAADSIEDGTVVDRIGPSMLRDLMRTRYGERPRMVDHLEMIERRWAAGLIPHPKREPLHAGTKASP